MKMRQNDYWERYREIGHQISYYRKHRQMTQEELAEKLDVSRQHIAAIEAPNVNRKISMDLLFDIAYLLDIEPNCFLKCQEIPLPKTEGSEETNSSEKRSN